MTSSYWPKQLERSIRWLLLLASIVGVAWLLMLFAGVFHWKVENSLTFVDACCPRMQGFSRSSL